MSYIIAKKTAAETSEIIDLTREPFPKTIFAVGLQNAEEIEVLLVDTEPASPVSVALYDPDGVAVVLTATSQPLTIPGPCHLQFDKPVTANVVGVRLQEITV